MKDNHSYSGRLMKIKSRGQEKAGWFQPDQGSPFRIRARALPTVFQNLSIEGLYTTEHTFIITRYRLLASISELLPSHFASRHPTAFQRMQSHLDENIRTLIEQPELLDRWTVGDKQACDLIKNTLIVQYTVPNLLNFLQRFELSRKMLHEICELLGFTAIDLIEGQPYLLNRVPSIPFRVADMLALEAGIAANSPYRIGAAVQYVYMQYLNGGNSYINAAEFENRVNALLGKSLPKDKIRLEIERFAQEQDHELICRGNLYFDRHLYFAEIQIAQRLADLISCPTSKPGSLSSTIRSLISEGRLPDLDRDQHRGIEQFFDHPVLLVRGEAGTGKSSWIAYLLIVLQILLPGIQIKLAAPTGKAARQLEVVTGYPAQTIHSLLGKGREKNSRIWYHYKRNPLNADVLIIDEASMVNEYLWRDLLWSVERGTRLVFVGDPNQLEPIGPGRPFLDMISLGFPTVTLKRNYRNDSAILSLARAVLLGEVDYSQLEVAGIRMIPTETVEETKETIVRMYQDNAKQYPVITMYREQYSLGTDRLNEYMKQRINPVHMAEGMGAGDPVIQMTNTSRADNGEVGMIRFFNPTQSSCIFFEPDKEVLYTFPELMSEMELAYAITTAKTQGSQYEGVIIPLTDIGLEIPHRQTMWYKNSLYTALTRARKELVLIGDPHILINGARRKGLARKTMLVKRIKHVFKGTGILPDTNPPAKGMTDN
ncbi:AAA family ATPase [Paenibacillus sp. OV219]|uniref:AAA family ATPase n=1 Tax=Paenibacillus sp. OV219 TaxID=1884377 RepID=UPI0008CED7F9|nr:AAA family ATPase [Paenibacillus sp. OV219]SEN05100.1 helicase, putative, RecD/TraA family [Paenibacillus sp. OV219]